MSDLADLFPGYEANWINTSQGRIFARVGGKGPPLPAIPLPAAAPLAPRPVT